MTPSHPPSSDTLTPALIRHPLLSEYKVLPEVLLLLQLLDHGHGPHGHVSAEGGLEVLPLSTKPIWSHSLHDRPRGRGALVAHCCARRVSPLPPRAPCLPHRQAIFYAGHTARHTKARTTCMPRPHDSLHAGWHA